MLLFSTILFVNGIPVSYDVYKEYRLVFKPAEIKHTLNTVPLLYAEKNKNSWIISGTNDQGLVAQAIEDIKNNEYKLSIGPKV